MEISTIGGAPDTRPEQLGPPTKTPSTKTVRGRLYRMSVILKDNRMTISLTGEDMTGILRYLSHRVSRRGLSIEECFGKTLQDRHGSTFLVTGPPEQLRSLADDLEKDGDEELEGDQITPYKTFDLTIMVPDRVGLIGNVSSLLYEYKFNITSFNSFVCPDPMGTPDGPSEGPESPRDLTLLDLTMHGLGSRDPERPWACLQVRLEVGRDGMRNVSRLRQQLSDMRPVDGPGGRRLGKIHLREYRLAGPSLRGRSGDLN